MTELTITAIFNQAHKRGAPTPSLAHFAATIRTGVLPKREATRAGPGSR